MSHSARLNCAWHTFVLKMGYLLTCPVFVMSGESGVYEKSQVGLAKKLNAARKTVVRWLKEPGCPGKTDKGFNVAA